MGHRRSIRYGGPCGSSAAGQGDVAVVELLGSTVDTFSCVAELWRSLFQFIVKWWILLLFLETGTHSVKLCKVVDYPVMAQRTFPLVPCSRPQRFPSCSLLIRWSSWLHRSCSSGTRREETVEIPQLQPVFLTAQCLVLCGTCCASVTWCFWFDRAVNCGYSAVAVHRRSSISCRSAEADFHGLACGRP